MSRGEDCQVRGWTSFWKWNHRMSSAVQERIIIRPCQGSLWQSSGGSGYTIGFDDTG